MSSVFFLTSLIGTDLSVLLVLVIAASLQCAWVEICVTATTLLALQLLLVWYLRTSDKSLKSAWEIEASQVCGD